MSPRFRRGARSVSVCLRVFGSMALVLSGCRSRPRAPDVATASANEASAAPAPSERAWSAVLRRLGPNGTITKDAALQMFALQIAPLPGVSTPASDESVPHCSTPAVLGVTAHWSELTPDQRAAVRRALTPVAIARAQLAPITGQSALDEPAQLALRNEVFAAVVQTAASLGMPEVQVSEIEGHVGAIQRLGGGSANAQALPALTQAEESLRDGGDTNASLRGRPVELLTDPNTIIDPTRCHLRLTLNMNPAERARLIRHEIFHCYQFAALGRVSRRALAEQPMWLSEGSAEWWSQSQMPATSPLDNTERGFVATYFESGRIDLADLSYAAFPFFVHVASLGVTPRTILDATTLASDSAVRRLLRTSDRAANSWASRTAGLAEPRDWRLDATRLSGQARRPQQERLASSPLALEARTGVLSLVQVDTSAQPAYAVEVVGAGRLRLSATEERTWNQAASLRFCRDAGCECGNNQSLASNVTRSSSTAFLAGFTTLATSAESVIVRPLTDAERCEEVGTVDPCLRSGTWTLDNAHFQQQIQGLVGAGREAPTVSGTETLRFTETEGVVLLGAFTVTLSMSGIGSRVRGIGEVVARVSTSGGSLHSRSVNNRASFSADVRLGSQWTAAPIPSTFSLAPFLQPSTLSYTCSQRQLELRVPNGTTLRYTR